MLVRRIVTAVFLVLPIIAGLVFAPDPWLTILALALYAVGAWEWSGFLSTRNTWHRPALFVVYVALLVLAVYFLDREHAIIALFAVTMLWWIVALVWMTRFPTSIANAAIAVCGALVLVPPLVTILFTRAAHDALLIIFIFAVVWAADIGAFFTGRALGRRKLAPRVSPGKTWEGFFGGLAAAMLAALAYGLVVEAVPLSRAVVLGLAGAVASVVGDLTVSMFKRHAGLKDSGRIFPGHGGVLDRFDSFSAAAPVVFGLFYLLGHVGA